MYQVLTKASRTRAHYLPFLLLFTLFTSGTIYTQKLQLANNEHSDYKILLNSNASQSQQKAANVLQNYFHKVTAVKLAISNVKRENELYISLILSESEGAEHFEIKNVADQLIISANTEKTLLYGVYQFISTYLKCEKWTPNEKAACPKIPNLQLDLPLHLEGTASFAYREVYSTAESDPEYMDWYGLQSLDDLWGLWGHSFNKLVPQSLFNSHPEYFSLVNGHRNTDQLCLSHPEVFQLTLKALENLFKNNPEAQYWSISSNDNNNYCECSLCEKTDLEEGGPQGSVLKFVNKIANHYPDKTFTTLAYGATLDPPLKKIPNKNIIIFLSSIDAYKTKPIEMEASGAGFRNALDEWIKKGSRVFIWDYYTQFTNYLAPFPDVFNIGPNIYYYHKKGVTGVFSQLGGDQFVYGNELKTYVLAKKSWNKDLDENMLIDEFLQGYYGKAAPLIKNHLVDLQTQLLSANKRLDIYGNPIDGHASYLTPKYLETVVKNLDLAEKAAESKEIRSRIQKLKLSFYYSILKQARFFGIDDHGIYRENHRGELKVRKEIISHFKKLMKIATQNGITILSEDGTSLDEYASEWKMVFQKKIPLNKATPAKIEINQPFIPEYPAKGITTLIDGMYGFKDFSYNWLLFENNLSVTLDLHEITNISRINIDFLEDQRHWIFLPQSVDIEISSDGINYEKLTEWASSKTIENSQTSIQTANFILNKKARFIKVKAETIPSLPIWRTHKTKRPIIAVSEIWIK